MKRKLYIIYKKYKIAIYIALLVLLVGILGITLFNILNSNSKLITLKEKNYSLKYDNSWKVKDKNKEDISLIHKSSKSLLKIEIISLSDENKYTDMDSLIEEVLYSISKQNKKYNLISKQKSTFTKSEYAGYKLLYENDKEQVMIMTFKKSDKLVIASYEANNKYFDMVLDSAENIIYNFDTVEKSFKLKNSVKTNTSKISYSKDKKLDKLLTENKKYTVAHNNYKVVYEIPSVFERSTFDTTWNYFNLKGYEKSNITIKTSIYNKNIYEYLDKDNSSSVYEIYKYYKKNEDVTNFKEQISSLKSKFSDSYIYKNSYKMKYTSYSEKNENVELIYSLDKSHILIITIGSREGSITKKLVDSIKVNSASNYSSYTKNKIDNGYVTAKLQKYKGGEKDKTYNVNIKLPDSYEEIDNGQNLYNERYFGLNYNEDKGLYDYIIHFIFAASKEIDENIKNLNTYFTNSYGKCNYYQKFGEKNINNKQFTEYIGGYTYLGGTPFTNVDRFYYYINHKALFYKLSDESYLIVEIKGNDKEISDDIINQATNFEINEKDVK